MEIRLVLLSTNYSNNWSAIRALPNTFRVHLPASPTRPRGTISQSWGTVNGMTCHATPGRPRTAVCQLLFSAKNNLKNKNNKLIDRDSMFSENIFKALGFSECRLIPFGFISKKDKKTSSTLWSCVRLYAQKPLDSYHHYFSSSIDKGPLFECYCPLALQISKVLLRWKLSQTVTFLPYQSALW